MLLMMSGKIIKTIPFNTKKSIKRATAIKRARKGSAIEAEGKIYYWSSNMERINIIRDCIPYRSIEIISKRLNRPIKSVLAMVGMPQTTYNKKIGENSLLDSRISELIVLTTELLDFGVEVFDNDEEKFQRWLKKPNLSLGGISPESLLDTTTGIDEVKFALNRIEFGNLA